MNSKVKKYKVAVMNGRYTVEVLASSPADAEYKVVMELSDPQKLRALAQGASFMQADEAEAGIRSLAGGDYELERDMIRAKNENYRQNNPLTSLALEFAGAALPALATRGTSVPAQAPPLVNRLSRALGIGAVEGAITGYGASEGDTLTDQVTDAAKGFATGAVLNPVLGGTFRGLGKAGSKFMDFTREKLGDKASNAVQAELRRLQEQTGKSMDEILSDLNDGLLLADNATLRFALKNYVNQGGEAGKEILEQASQRIKSGTTEAKEAIESGLTGGLSGNQRANFARAKDELKKLESKLYQEAYEVGGDPSPELLGQISNIIKRYPEAADDLLKQYSERADNLVPLFSKKSDGSVSLDRMPTAEDTEILYRGIRDFSTSLFKSDKTGRAKQAKEASQELKDTIDVEFPAVGEARSLSKQNFSNNDAFELGLKALGGSSEQTLIDMAKLSGTQLEAFRTGLMSAINDKLKAGARIGRFADPENKLGEILRTALPDGQADDIMKTLGISAEKIDTAKSLPSSAGSQTKGLTEEAGRSGSGFNLQDATGVLTGDLNAGLRMLSGLVGKVSPKLSDDERLEIVKVLYSSDPNLIVRALTDQTALRELTDMIGKYARGVTNTLTVGTQQQAVDSVTSKENQ